MNTLSEFSKKILSDLPYRENRIPGWASVFRIPMYVSRVDIDEFGKAGTHGWQVRYRGTNRFFSDSHYGKRKIGSPKLALSAASEYLASIYQGRPLRLKSKSIKNKQGPDLGVGIRIAKKVSAGRKVQEYFIEVSAVSRSHQPKRFYIGTENTRTPEKDLLCLKKAQAYRKRCISQIEKQAQNRLESLLNQS